MKKYLLVLLFCLCSPVWAASGYVKGQVEYIRIADEEIHGSGWAPPTFWFTLKGVTSAGSCRIHKNRLLFIMDTAEAYAMIMGAFMANKEVSVHYDDAHRSTRDFCKATLATLGNPPPLE